MKLSGKVLTAAVRLSPNESNGVKSCAPYFAKMLWREARGESGKEKNDFRCLFYR